MCQSDSNILLMVRTLARKIERRPVRAPKHARISVLISILLHVSLVAIASLVAFGVSRTTLHAPKCIQPIVLTVLGDAVRNLRDPDPLQLLAAPENKDLEPMVLPSPTEAATDLDQKSVETGFQDIDAGGTLEQSVAVSSGGGGGDAVEDPAEIGHVRTSVEQWSRIKFKTDAASPSVIGVAGSGGGAVPGTLAAVGSGKGLGNGAGSGALGSRGSGTGSGTGINGQGAGNGTGTKPIAGIIRGVRPMRISAPSYPSEAKRFGHEGLVKVTVEVLANGKVGRVELAFSSGYGELDSAALNAARDWRFQPATRDGEPVAAWVTVPYRYVLSTAPHK